MNALIKSFLHGLLILVPLGATAYVVWLVVVTLDGWIDLPVPGITLLITIGCITFVGYLGSNVIGRKILETIERMLFKLPVVKLLYSSLKDLLNAFVGEKRSFDRPVSVQLNPGLKLFGFMTCTHFDDPQLAEYVAVYLPQAYNFAGNLVIVPRHTVSEVDADSAQFMAFVMSGGVAEMNAAQTLYGTPLIDETPSPDSGRP